MNFSTSIAVSTKGSRAFAAIFSAGLLCGVLDIIAAFITSALRGIQPVRILQYIASGLLGAKSFSGGISTATLGAAFHFLFAFSAAVVFYAASRKLGFMLRRPVVSGILYGIAVYVFMYWLVIPLSNASRSPFSVLAAIVAILTHIVCIGLTISLVVHHYSKGQP